MEPSKSSHKKPAHDLLLTHENKVYWPDGTTKGELLHYYQTIAPIILPYLKGRPETLHRYPSGTQGVDFYQRNLDPKAPDWLKTCMVEHEGVPHRYLLIEDEDSLLYAINLGCIDLHPWGSRVGHLQTPDYMVIDLDPEHSLSFDATVEVALAFHGLFEELKLPNYCKTSGAHGLHIYLPLKKKETFEAVRLRARSYCEEVHRRLPELTTLTRSVAKRGKTVYLDEQQNSFGHSLAAPYCVRPQPGATVSTPLEWKEVKAGLDPKAFTIHTVPARCKSLGDLFLPVIHPSDKRASS